MSSKLEPGEALPKAVLDRAREVDTSSSDWLQSVFGESSSLKIAIAGGICVAIGAAAFLYRAKKIV